MSDIDQLLAQIPLAQIAQELGVDESQAEASSRTALEALLGGLQANASDPAGALSLGRALGNHDGTLLGAHHRHNDQDDGSPIEENIFGGTTSEVIAQLGGVKGSGGSSLIAKLLPILAPFVLAWLGKKLRGQGGLGDILGQVLGGAAGGAGGAASGSGGGLGDILGQVLGGGGTSTDSADSASDLPEEPTGPLIPTDGGGMTDITDDPAGSAPQDNPMGGVLGDILGQVLGGASSGSGSASGSGSRSGTSPSITDILGGLLGGGKR